MLRRVFFIACLLLAGLLCAAGFVLGRQIPFAQQWPLFEALRNTASIIFAVVGAWLAIIYPERLKLSFGRPGDSQGAKTGSNIKLLLTPAVHSTIILVVLLLIGVCAPLIKQLSVVASHLELFRGLSFATVTALTCWQVVIVVMTIFPADTVQTAIDIEEATAEMLESRRTLRRHRKT